MFIDASALTAILLNEQDARELLARMQNDDRRITSPLAVWETVLAVARCRAACKRDPLSGVIGA
jgi:ribonuclease VapC